jgi:hypothetical protein
MNVLTWSQQRSRILSRLAGIDQSISSRTENIQNAWHAMRDAGHYLDESARDVPAVPQETSATTRESSSVPEYLR